MTYDKTVRLKQKITVENFVYVIRKVTHWSR